MFIETPRFPDGIARGSKYGPAWSTSKAYNIAGVRASNQNWSMPLYEGDVRYGIKTQAQYEEIIAFLLGTGGANGFRFKDYRDYSTTGSQGTLLAIDATHWQLQKTYVFGALSTARKIVKPIAGAVIAGGGSYSYSTVTGIITKSAGADPTGWTGEFDNPVEFMTDKLIAEWLSKSLSDFPEMPIRELRL